MNPGVDNQLYVGAKPWHGQGTEIPAGMSVVESLKRNPILSSQIDRCPMMFGNFDGTMGDADGQFAHVRRADKRVLGYGGPAYTVAQPLELGQFADDVSGPLGATFEIAGNLRSGSQFVLQARVGNPVAVAELADGRDDSVGLYLTLGTSHDGERMTEIGFATVRAECWNMTALAMSQIRSGKRGSRYFQLRHSGDLKSKLVDAKDALANGLKAWGEFQQFAVKAAQTVMPVSDFGDFTMALLPDVLGKDNSRVSSKRLQLATLFASGRGNQGRTVWDAYNGVTEYVNYFASVRGADNEDEKAQSRLNSTLYGQGAAFAAEAEQALRVYVSIV